MCASDRCVLKRRTLKKGLESSVAGRKCGMRGPSMGRMALSRRDGVVVAWQEVPGQRHPRRAARRVRRDSCRCAHRSDDCNDEGSNTDTEYGTSAIPCSARESPKR
jgi:hypothetical protein